MTDNFEKLCAEADARRGRSSKTWRDGLISAKALQTKTFDPVRIIVPGLIPEGVTIVAGKPKIGKSFLALDICMAVAGDRFVLGETKPVQGDALYLALEDNQRRLKKRIDKIVQNGGAPERLELHTEWKRMDNGGLEDIEAWCKSAQEPRLIWIDTLAKIRPWLAAMNKFMLSIIGLSKDYKSSQANIKLVSFSIIIFAKHRRKMTHSMTSVDIRINGRCRYHHYHKAAQRHGESVRPGPRYRRAGIRRRVQQADLPLAAGG